jgi:hypothetical protein
MGAETTKPEQLEVKYTVSQLAELCAKDAPVLEKNPGMKKHVERIYIGKIRAFFQKEKIFLSTATEFSQQRREGLGPHAAIIPPHILSEFLLELITKAAEKEQREPEWARKYNMTPDNVRRVYTSIFTEMPPTRE